MGIFSSKKKWKEVENNKETVLYEESQTNIDSPVLSSETSIENDEKKVSETNNITDGNEIIEADNESEKDIVQSSDLKAEAEVTKSTSTVEIKPPVKCEVVPVPTTIPKAKTPVLKLQVSLQNKIEDLRYRNCVDSSCLVKNKELTTTSQSESLQSQSASDIMINKMQQTSFHNIYSSTQPKYSTTTTNSEPFDDSLTESDSFIQTVKRSLYKPFNCNKCSTNKSEDQTLYPKLKIVLSCSRCSNLDKDVNQINNYINPKTREYNNNRSEIRERNYDKYIPPINNMPYRNFQNPPNSYYSGSLPRTFPDRYNENNQPHQITREYSEYTGRQIRKTMPRTPCNEYDNPYKPNCRRWEGNRFDCSCNSDNQCCVGRKCLSRSMRRYDDRQDNLYSYRENKHYEDCGRFCNCCCYQN